VNQLDEILEAHAKKWPDGGLVLAHLRRQDDGRWDTLVVGSDLMPLAFWSSGAGAPANQDILRDDHGNILTVVVATPPGVEPSGLLVAPANAHGSPFATMVSMVTAEGYTPIGDLSEQEHSAPAEGVSKDMLRSLIDNVVDHDGGGKYRVGRLTTDDGGSVQVLLDWNGAPVLFWVDMPGDPPDRELMSAAALPSIDGFVAVAVNDDLTPIKSEDVLKALLESS
jgi:hypothetical protein